MDVNRRQFIQITGATAAGLAVGGLGFDLKPVRAHAGMLKTKYAKETTTICCYCAVGCGAIVHTSKRGDGRVLNIEGDPDHVINRGALCSKGASLKQLAENENRLTQPMYRAPYADKWQSVSWDWALEKIAHRVKETRDASFTLKNAKARPSTAPRPLRRWAVRPWTTRSAGSTRPSCDPWGWCISNTRRASDTAPRLRLWQSRSDAVR
jgi:formate dehydrogenase major subunit